MLSALPHARHETLLWLAGLGAAAFVVYRSPLSTSLRLAVAYAEAGITAVAVNYTGGSSSALLPYLLVPGLALGLHAGPRAVLQGATLSALLLLAGRLSESGTNGLDTFAAAAVQWVLLGVAVGLVASWARRLAAGDVVIEDSYVQARALLEQLRTVSRGLPGGLDAPSAAESLLDDATRQLGAPRSAVLAQTVPGGALVPLAVRGMRRVPWRTPLSQPGPLQQAWESRMPVVDRRKPDKNGRRHGSSLLVLPLVGSTAPYGLLIMESEDLDAFPDRDVRVAAEAGRQSVLRLETALLFDEVRSVVTVEERDRLAREMHDGVAQDLAFIGYRLDALRIQAARIDEGLAATAAEVRGDLTDLIGNLRLSITDLRTSVSADRGLGSALSSYLRAIGSGHRLAVHLSLQESPFRLPAEQEVLLFRTAQVVIQEVRRVGRTRNLWVTLTVDPPSAHLLIEHDGPPGTPSSDQLTDMSKELGRLGGSVQVRDRRRGGTTVEAAFKGETDGGQRTAGG